MTEAPENQRPKDMIKAYIAAHPEIQNKPVEQKALPIADPEKLKKTIEEFGKNFVYHYLKVDEEGGFDCVNKITIDQENDVQLTARRERIAYPEKYRINNAFMLTLTEKGREVGKFNLHNSTNLTGGKSTDFNLTHRVIKPEYRGQIKGLGTAMLKAMEGFVQEYVNQTGAEKGLNIHAAQLDVLSWLDVNGYKPVADATKSAQDVKVNSVERMENILAFLRGENDNYHIGPDMYVFPKEVPESEFREHNIKNNPNDKSNIDGKLPGTIAIDKAATVHFQKRFEPKKTNPKAQDIIDVTRDGVLGK